MEFAIKQQSQKKLKSDPNLNNNHTKTLLENTVFFPGNSSKKIPNLNMCQKDHSIILDKSILTCQL
jgi:hypothetical protein